jgi:nucleoid-associated protein YgaU
MSLHEARRSPARRIAYYAYSNANWWNLFQANAGQISDPDLIYPGQVLTVP